MNYDAACNFFRVQAAKIYAAKSKQCWGKWLIQIITPYPLLPESDKDYDRRKALEFCRVAGCECRNLEALAAVQHKFWRYCRVLSVLCIMSVPVNYFVNQCLTLSATAQQQSLN
jgi:hypothetical protein